MDTSSFATKVCSQGSSLEPNGSMSPCVTSTDRQMLPFPLCLAMKTRRENNIALLLCKQTSVWEKVNPFGNKTIKTQLSVPLQLSLGLIG